MQLELCTGNLADKSPPHAHVTYDYHMTDDHVMVQILYGILLTRRKEYIDHPITRRFHVRVLIPCYSESLEIVSATALAARRATLPPGVRRTGTSLYACTITRRAVIPPGVNRTGTSLSVSM